MRTGLVGMKPVGATSGGGRALWYAQDDDWRTSQGRAALAISGATPAAPSVFGTGRQLLAGTTNLVPNPSIEVDTAGYAANGGGVSRSTDQALFGTCSLNATSFGAYIGTGFIIPVTALATYTGSLYVYLPTGGTYSVYLREFTAGQAAVGQTLVSMAVPAATWTRLTVTRTMSATGAFCDMLTSADTAGTHYLDGMQIELGDSATPYCDGSLGGGFAWTGTAHTSPSTRAASEVEAPSRALSPLAGAACAWLRPDWGASSTAEHVLWHWRVTGGRELLVRYVGGEWRLEAAGGGASAFASTPAVHAAGGDAFVWASWDAGRLTVGTEAGSAVAARGGALTAIASATLRLGARADTSGGAIDAAVDTLLFLDRPLTVSEAVAYARLAHRPR